MSGEVNRSKSKKRKVKNESSSEDEVSVEEQLHPKKKMKKDMNSKTDPSDWPYEDILTLFEKVEGLLPKVDTMRYTRRLEKINWEKVKFGDYSSIECSSVFNTMIKRVRLRPTVSDLITNMKAMHERQPRFLMGVCGPKKPLTAYFLFVQDKQRKLKRKNPNLTPTDLSKVLSEKYKNLSPRKKQKYFDKYQANVDTFRAQLAKFNEDNPDKVDLTNNDGKCPKCQTPSSLFIKDRVAQQLAEDAEMTLKQAHDQAAAKWKKLKDKKKVKWIKKAMEAFEEYKAEAAEYQRTHPSYVPKASCLTRNELHLKELSEGMPPKPPMNALQLYKKLRFPEVQQEGESFVTTNSRINKEWQQLVEPEREEYKQQVKQAKEEYAVAYQEYLEAHPEKAKQADKLTPKKKKKAVANGLNEDDSDSETLPQQNHRVAEPVRSALSYYIEEQSRELLGSDSDTSQSDLTMALTKKFKQLADKEKQKYRDMATRNRNETLAASYNDTTSKKKGKASSKKVQAGPGKTYPGEPKRPPTSGYVLYSRKMLSKLTGVPTTKRMSVVGQKWKALSDKEKDHYNRKAKKKMRKYTEELEEFREMVATEDGGEQRGKPLEGAGPSRKSKTKKSRRQSATSSSLQAPVETSSSTQGIRKRTASNTTSDEMKAENFDKSSEFSQKVEVVPVLIQEDKNVDEVDDKTVFQNSFSDHWSGDSDISRRDLEQCHFNFELDNAESEGGESGTWNDFGNVENIDVSPMLWGKEIRICLTPVDSLKKNHFDTKNISDFLEHKSDSSIDDDSVSPVLSCKDAKVEIQDNFQDGISPSLESTTESEHGMESSDETFIKSEYIIKNVIPLKEEFFCKSESHVSSQEYDSKFRPGSLELFSSCESVVDNCYPIKASPDGVSSNEVSVYMPYRAPGLPPSIMDQCLSIHEDLEVKDMDLAAAEILSSLSVSPDQAIAVEAATRQQSACDAWYYHRRGRLTASSFAQISLANMNQKTSLLKKILSTTRYPTSSWGLDHESVALKAYKTLLSPHHENLQLRECGLVINPDSPHLGATPDSWVSCECCGQGVVEVKCPTFLPAFKPVQSSRCSFSFLQQHERTRPLCPPSLPRDHSHQYQIQGQMGVCGVQYCDLVCWTPSDIHVERVVRDRDFFTQLKHTLDDFYRTDVIPAILSRDYAESSQS